MTNSGGDLALAQQHDIIDQGLTHGERQLVVQADAATEGVSEAWQLLDLYWPTAGKAPFPRCAPPPCHPDIFRVGALTFDSCGDASTQPAAGDRDKHGGNVWQRIQYLKSDRPLPGD